MTRRTLTGLAAGLVLIAAACGDDGDDAASPTTAVVETTAPATEPTTAPTTAPAATTAPTSVPATTEPGQPADEYPTAIISLSPTSTETLYAIGAGDQVLAVDDFSNYPEEAQEKMQGLSGFQPNVEAIAALEPDLVITGGTNPDLLDQLDSLGIPRWEGPAAATFDDVYAQIEELGAVTGHEEEAAALVADMQAEVEEIQADLPELDEALTYYHELDPTFYSVTGDTFIGAVYGEVGLVSIADEVGDGNPFPQLNAEFIIDANPDLVFLACTIYCGETAETFGARDGWGGLDAVVNGNVVEMNDDIASRWGPRIVDYLADVADAVSAATDAEG